jgi:DNA-binding protein HU-beta
VAQAKTDKALTKSQIATHFAEKFSLTRRQAQDILDELANLAYSEARKKGEFTIPGVGKLVKQQRKARTGRNPATGEAIKIPAKTVMKFRVAKAAKDAVLPAKKK